jgi:hypothetical protein
MRDRAHEQSLITHPRDSQLKNTKNPEEIVRRSTSRKALNIFSETCSRHNVSGQPISPV